MGVACGPGYPLIRLQALRTGPVSAAIPNAKNFICQRTYFPDSSEHPLARILYLLSFRLHQV